MSNENAVRNLIRIDDKQNPTLFRALQLLIDDLYKINSAVFAADETATIDQTTPGGVILGPPQNFSGVAYPDNLRLDWDDLQGAFRYQIRMGNNWEAARHVVTTATDVANVDPLYLNLVYGTYIFFIRAVNIVGVLGNPASAVLIVPVIPPPDLSLEVVVSTVLLKWTEPASSWRIDHYNVYKDNILLGSIKGTFKLIQEQVGGDYAYSVEAVDIVGNVSTRSAQKIGSIHDPSEYAFVDELDADYTGDYVHTAKTVINGRTGVLGPIQIATWEEHYVTHGWDNPQEQIDAGYPIYYQPAFIGQGTYEEVFDFGQVYNDLTVIIDWSKLQLSGSTDVITQFSYSVDGINYSTPEFGSGKLIDAFQYVKVKWILTNQDDLSAAFLTDLKVLLNVTLTLDSGSIEALAADVGGTEVTYNKIFTGINSVTATAAISLQPLYAVCDAITKDNFRVLVFDSSGNRVDAEISWKARGVV